MFLLSSVADRGALYFTLASLALLKRTQSAFLEGSKPATGLSEGARGKSRGSTNRVAPASRKFEQRTTRFTVHHGTRVDVIKHTLQCKR